MNEKMITLDGIKVRYVVQSPAKGKSRARVLVLPGFTEFIEKHQDQIDGFTQMGLDAICLDWPGQGLSSRLAHDHPFKIHSPGYHQHLNAIKAVMKDAGWDDDKKPLLIFGHSMGGHLGLRLGHDLNSTEGVDLRGVMLSAPMIMIPVVMARFTLSLLTWICRLGFAKAGVPGQQGFSKGEGFNPINVLTRDPDGYMLVNKLFAINPDLKTKGPTFGWVRAALSSCLKTTRNKDWMRGVNFPVQAHLAGNELVVHRGASKPYLNEIRNIQIHSYDNARHELMLELPEVRAQIWERLGQFVDKTLDAPKA